MLASPPSSQVLPKKVELALREEKTSQCSIRPTTVVAIPVSDSLCAHT